MIESFKQNETTDTLTSRKLDKCVMCHIPPKSDMHVLWQGHYLAGVIDFRVGTFSD
ncbi:hypothetical protein R69608_06911 [Paraburkholderia nemoris]|nr:hypothetical protein R69608_06911 [Paraburkholderia nemoris]